MNIQQPIWLVGKWLFEITDTVTWKTRRIEKCNLIPTVWKTAFASQMSGDNTTDIWDNLYIAVWDDNTAPAAWDTTLWNETFRKIALSTSFVAWVCYISTFFSVWEVTGTHREFGLFWDWNAETASGSADSGILYSHVSASVTVSATETLTTTFQISFTS